MSIRLFDWLAMAALLCWFPSADAAPPEGASMQWLLDRPVPAPMSWMQRPDAHLSAASEMLAPGQPGPDLQPDRQRAPQGTLGAGRMLVFISLAMPEASLRGLFAAGAGRDDVTFVVRGWQPPNLYTVINKLRVLLPPERGKSEPQIVIQPLWFRTHAVRQVPVFVRANASGLTRKLLGEISLQGAEAKLIAEEALPEAPVGQLYEIDEPDIVAVAKGKIESVDWREKLEQARARALSNALGVELPSAVDDQVYWVNTETRIRRDIRLPDGTLVAPAGTRINPLEHMRMRHRYVFFDPSNPAHLEVVTNWQGEFSNLKLIASRFEPLSDSAEALAVRLGQPVFPANQMLVERFQIKALPAFAEQDGTRMKITVKRPAVDATERDISR